MSEDPVVIRSKAELLRNWSDLPFPGGHEYIIPILINRLTHLPGGESFHYFDLSETEEMERKRLEVQGFFSENQLTLERGGSLKLPGRNCFVEIGGEDQLNIRCDKPGLMLKECFDTVYLWEKRFEQAAPYAYDKYFGYLTASPRNAGTGLWMSVILHLPMLNRMKKIKGFQDMAERDSLRLHPICPMDDNQNPGDLYELQSFQTPGMRETKQRMNVWLATQKIAGTEQKLRESVDIAPSDGQWGSPQSSWDFLLQAKELDCEDFLIHYSRIRLGAAFRLLPISLTEADKLLQVIRLDLITSDPEKKSRSRAEKIRRKLIRAEQKQRMLAPKD